MPGYIELNKFIDVAETAHILYLFEDKDMYLGNMMAYIKAGLERGHHLLIIESLDLCDQIMKHIKEQFNLDEQRCIHFYDNCEFYKCYGDFHMDSIIKHFSLLLKPFYDKNLVVRTWAHVQWKDQDDIIDKISSFERHADHSVREHRTISVCAYNAFDITASLQTSMMKSHEYVMTDRELTVSTLYSINKSKEFN